MTIYELQELLEQSNIADLLLRCATYSRVSTEKETQVASLHNMTDDFRKFIDRHPNWTFIRRDTGTTGATASPIPPWPT